MNNRNFCNCENKSNKKYWIDYARTMDNPDKILKVEAEVDWDEGHDTVDCSPVFQIASEIFEVSPDEIYLCGFDPKEFPVEIPRENIGVYCGDCGGWL